MWSEKLKEKEFNKRKEDKNFTEYAIESCEQWKIKKDKQMDYIKDHIEAIIDNYELLQFFKYGKKEDVEYVIKQSIKDIDKIFS